MFLIMLVTVVVACVLLYIEYQGIWLGMLQIILALLLVFVTLILEYHKRVNQKISKLIEGVSDEMDNGSEGEQDER